MKQLSSWGFFLARALPVVASALGTLEVYYSKHRSSLIDRSTDFEVLHLIEERIPTIDLGTYPLDISLPKNDKLFTIAEGTSNTINSYNDTISVSISISATRVSCYLIGTAVVTTTGIKTDQSLLGDIISFLEDPIGAIVSALDLDLEVNLENLAGHFEFDIAFAISGSYTLQIFKTETPVGIQLDDDNKVGILFTLELIITVTGQLDFTMGFDISFPKGASFVMNPLTGHIVSMNLGGAKVTQIPVTFKSGSACVTAILRLKFSAGLSVEEFGYGFDFEAGVYWDPIQYKACVTYEPSAPCEIEYTEYFYEEIAAYARAVEQIDYTKWGAAPTAVATYITATLPSACLESSSHKVVPHTTTVPVKTTPPALPDESSSTKPPAPHSTPPTTNPKPSTVTSSTIRRSSSSSRSPSITKPTSSTRKSSSSSSSGKVSSTESHHTTDSQTGPPAGTQQSDSTTSSPSEGSSGGVYHQHSAGSSSGPPFGNYSMTMATSPSITNTETFTTVTNTNTGPMETAAGSTSAGSSAAVTTSGESSSIIILSGSTSSLTAAVSSAPPSTTESSSTDTGINTITVSTTSIYTVTSCFALMHICPTSLQSELTLTKTIIQYTTICPATQTEFPSALPSSAAPSAAASSAGPSTPPTPVSLTPCETPIISTIETEITSITGISIAVYSPSVTPSISSISVFIGTETLPGAIAAPSSALASSVAPLPSAAATTSNLMSAAPPSSPAPSTSTPSSTSPGFAGVIYSVGGFATPSVSPGTTMVASEANGQTSSTPTPTSTSSNGQPLDVFQQGSDAISSFNLASMKQRAVLWVAAFCCSLWMLAR